MMVSPKAAKEAGDKFGLKPVCAGPFKFVERVQQDRIVVEKFADYWNEDNVHIDRIAYLPIVDVDRAARQPASPASLDLIERAARDRHQGGARPIPSSSSHADPRSGYQGLTINSPTARQAKNPLGQDAKVRQALELSHRPRGDQPGRVQRRVRAGQPVGQPEEPLLSEELPGPEARRRQGQGAAQGGRRARRRSRSTSWCRQGAESKAGRRGDPGDGGGGRLRHEDPRHRVRDLAQGGRAGRISRPT